jgi:hypothetical protein
VAVKSYNTDCKPYLHLYVERGAGVCPNLFDEEMLKEKLIVYFLYVKLDSKDLVSLLGVDPLRVTLLPPGVIGRYEKANGCTLRRINPFQGAVAEILREKDAE